MNSFSEILNTYDSPIEIGKGGGGTVYKAYHRRMRSYVILKKAHDIGRSEADLRKEADILKELHHRYLPQVIDYFNTDRGVFTVMTYVPGETFKELIEEGRIFSKEEIKKWTLQLLSALDYLHTRKSPVIHGDIKPSNVILKPDGDICLIDFNISIANGDVSVAGFTRGFASPEQYKAAYEKACKKETSVLIDQRSDIYSLGALLYYISTGERRNAYNEKIDITTMRRQLGNRLAESVAKAMSTNPMDRFETAKSMALSVSNEKNTEPFKISRVCIIVLVVVILMLGSVTGVRGLQYNSLVNQQEECINNCNLLEAEEKYKKAIDIRPRKIDAYYQKARGLYSEGDYGECLNYIENKILANDSIRKRGGILGEVYKLAGLCCVDQDEATKAVYYFEKAIVECEFTGNDYRDYAVALAHNSKYDEANAMLDEAEKKGAKSGTAEYVSGEIAYANGQYDKAVSELWAAINKTDDDNLKFHSYWTMSKVHKVQGNLLNSLDVLKEAEKIVSTENRVAVIQSLIDINIDLADNTGNNMYRQDAAQWLNELIDKNWATKDDYHTLAVLYIKINNLDGANNIIEKKGTVFEKDYDYYKLKAIAEVHKQEQLSAKERSYYDFERYYLDATNLYKSSINDPEMDTLGEMYIQIKNGGWL